MTIAHTGIIVPKAKVAEVVAWYLKALEPLGYRKIVDHYGVAIGLGDKEHEADFWVIGGDITENISSHHAFAAPGKFLRAHGSCYEELTPRQDQATVQAFHKAAIDAGGKDNGPPGLRPQYHAGYYGAFVDRKSVV